MLSHTNKQAERTVILGANGFIGKALKKILDPKTTLTLGRAEVDLSQRGSSDILAKLLKPTDAIVFLSTITPDKGRGLDAFVANIKMAEHFCNALKQITPQQIVYLSSDAIYSLNRNPLTENSPADPENLYGVMHLAREYMIKTSIQAPLAILRSTLVYGHEDTHNSYGPNRMRRMAFKEGKITLFGEGEECRDHIFIDDLVKLISLVLHHGSSGLLNLVTGHSISYKDLALQIASYFDHPIEITPTPRNNPITHRHFDPSAIYKSFPLFQFTSLEDGLRNAHEQEFKKVQI